MSDEQSLEHILTLDGYRFSYGGASGYWCKFNFKKVKIDEHRPHGLKYEMTLHDANGTRVIGYDNAHNPNLDKGGRHYAPKRQIYDHKHRGNTIEAYAFEGPGKLIEDFYADVNSIVAIVD